MCRFAAYLGHPLRLSQLVTEPTHSIIHQSFHSEERREPLNGDGFGVAWYNHALSPVPAIFKDVRPAWNCENLRELARVTESRCMLAHVRAASPQSSVHQLNCHPFCYGHLAFMHNGVVGGFRAMKRRLLEVLSDEAFLGILGSTDSEHALALLWDRYRPLADQPPLERMALSLQETIKELERLRHILGIQEPSYLNFCLSDGERLVATRYSSHADEGAASLYYTTGQRLHIEDGHYRLVESDTNDVVVIASEKLSPKITWYRVPANHMVLASHPGTVELRPLVGPGLPQPPAGRETTRITLPGA